jgi:cell division protein FtsQ
MTYARYKKKLKSKKTLQPKPAGVSAAQKSYWLLNMFQPWLPYCLFILLLALVAKLWLIFASPVSFPLAHVDVEATYQHISRTHLRQAVSASIHGGFFSFDASTLKSQLERQLPWLQSVSVRRVWPNRLRLNVTERKAIAVWDDDSLVTPEGHLFSPPKSEFPANLPQLFGPPDAFSQVFKEYFSMRDLLSTVSLHIARLEMTERGAWHLELADGVRVLVGRQDVLSRLTRFVRAYDRIAANHVAKIEKVDLRYPNGFALAFEPS